MENTVIIFGDNSYGSLGILRSLGEKGIKPNCVLLASDKGLLFDSKYTFMCIFVDSMEDGYRYIIDNYSDEKIKPIIISSTDKTSSFIDLHYNELKDKFYIHNAKEPGRITYFMDKVNIGKLAEKHGFMIPRFWIYTKEENDISHVEFPCFVKADLSLNGYKQAETVCVNRDELRKFVDSHDFQRLVIQDYIDKADELCCQGISINGGDEVYIPFHETFLHFTKKAFGGYVVLKPNTDCDRNQKIQSMLKEIGYTGMFSAEFLIDKMGNYYFTEINLRYDGFAYFTTSGGANLPYLFCKGLIEGNLGISDVRLRKKIIGMNEKYYYSQAVRSGDVPFIKFIWQYVTADSHLLSNIKDNGPLFSYLKRYVNKICRKLNNICRRN